MANQIQVTVVNIGGYPQKTPVSQAFETANIIVSNETIATSSTANSKIRYYYAPNQMQEYYVEELFDDILSAANTDGTSQVQVTAYKMNGYDQNTPLDVSLPANGIIIQTVTGQSPINTIVSYMTTTFSVSETEADIVTAANAGGGGGGGVTSVFGRTGVVTADAGDYAAYYVPLLATGNVLVNLDTHALVIANTNGNIHLDADGSVLLQSPIGHFNFDASEGSITISDTRVTPLGVEYSADYSANYTDRSLVDKAWVVAQIAAIPAGITGTMSANRIPYGVSASVLTTAAALAFNGTDTLTIGGGSIRDNSSNMRFVASGGWEFFNGTNNGVIFYNGAGSDGVVINGLGRSINSASNTTDLILQNANAAGKLGVGIAPTTAKLQIAAGTTALGPLGLTAGTLTTTPVLGTMEYVDDGTTGHLYFTYKVATVTTRREFTLT